MLQSPPPAYSGHKMPAVVGQPVGYQTQVRVFSQAEVDAANATAERRQRENEQTHCIMGMLCGGFLVWPCYGREQAANCGINFLNRALCMDVWCGGF